MRLELTTFSLGKFSSISNVSFLSGKSHSHGLLARLTQIRQRTREIILQIVQRLF